MSEVVFPLTIYYDHSCPLCRDEVDLLREHNVGGRLAFVDCSAPGFVEHAAYSRAAMMRLIHAQDAQGKWLVGPPVFSAAYRAIGAGSVAALWGAPWLQPIWNTLYPRLADNRQRLSRVWLFSIAMRVFKRFVAWSANRRAERTVAESCAVGSKDCR